MIKTVLSLAEYWHIRVRAGTGCWLWLGSCDENGYGRMHCNGAQGALAHRFSWELHNGSIPDGLFVCHDCDNPQCVRPGHLFLGTSDDNNKDRARKGRTVTRHGSTHPLAKLDEEKVRAIRQAWAIGTEDTRQLAQRYGVAFSLIHRVIKRRSWAHVTD